MIPIEHVIPWFLALVLFGIAGMINIWKNQRCRWCPHCTREEQEREARRRETRHQSFHQYRSDRAEDCRDGECPGRRV